MSSRPTANRLVATLAYCDVWRRGVVFAVGPEDLVADHVRRRYGVELPASVLDEMKSLSATGGVALTANSTGERDILIWAPKPISLSCLVHECVHAATDILKYVGADDSDEARAYLTEFLFHRFSSVTSCVRPRSSRDVSSPRK